MLSVSILVIFALVLNVLALESDVATLTAGDSSKFVSDLKVVDRGNATVTSYGWSEFKQCDYRWASQQIGYCSSTICSVGCAMSSVAMILNTKGMLLILLLNR